MLKTAPAIIRSEAHLLRTDPAVREDIERTIAAFRIGVRALCGVIFTHWPQIGPISSKSRVNFIESLFHVTRFNPAPRYAALDRLLGKMPSYLRRAAIQCACGVVSSFTSNYSNWLDGEIGGKKRAIGSKTPKLGVSNVFPPLYGGNMILVGQLAKKFDELGQERNTHDRPNTPNTRLKTPHGFVRIKLLNAKGLWAFSQPLQIRGRAKRMGCLSNMALSPTLMLRGAKASLSCPVEFRATSLLKTNKEIIQHNHRVCSVDVGINTAATVAIVDSTGTVIARKFLSCDRHNDRRDNLGTLIAFHQTLSGLAGPGFCSNLHRRIAGLSLDAARGLAKEIIAFALEHKAQAIVVEDLKGWRPKAHGAQKKRFHRFQHRMLIKYLGQKAQEHGMRLLEIYARGTSRWAFDGSGKVARSKGNAQLATFSSGKQYNADLNGALNIAARGLAMILGVKADPECFNQAETGKSSGSVARMPLVLADIWKHSKDKSFGVPACV